LRLLTTSQRPLHVFILTLLPDQAAAEDVLQNTNMIICREAASFTEGTNFLAWARAIARNQVISFVRDRGRDRHVFDLDLVEQLTARAEGLSVSLGQLAGHLDECLKRRTPEEQELLNQRYSNGSSVKEIATRRATTPHAVSNLLYRLRRALLDCVQRKLAAEGRK
jgi:RNA polymerase sigma-70 factor (ECF subfamily)